MLKPEDAMLKPKMPNAPKDPPRVVGTKAGAELVNVFSVVMAHDASGIQCDIYPKFKKLGRPSSSEYDMNPTVSFQLPIGASYHDENEFADKVVGRLIKKVATR